MACFLVPVGEAVVVTTVSKIIEHRVKAHGMSKDSPGYTRMNALIEKRVWLTNLLWGGSALLAFEHLWHGEVLPWFPFLSAASSSEDMVAMLHEMSTVGVAMAVVVSVVWIFMVLVAHALISKKSESIKN